MINLFEFFLLICNNWKCCCQNKNTCM